MKFRLFLALIIFSSLGFSQERGEVPYKPGEWLKFKVSYGLLNAGYASLEVNDTDNGDLYHINGQGWSIGMFKWFFKVDDHYQSFIDKNTLMSDRFQRDVYEGGYEINRSIKFDRKKLQAEIKDKKNDPRADSIYVISKNTHDMISAFYFARTFKEESVTSGQRIYIDIFMDYELYKFSLRYLGKEVIKTKFGKVECLKFIPSVQSGRVFKEDEGVTLWVSNDENKIPIRIESELRVGSVKVDLDAFKGLKYPFKIIQD